MNSIPNTSEQRPCWFVGASFGSTDDQTERFLKEGNWENGYHDRHLDQVKSMRSGDRIAIKAVFTQKHNLPFSIPEEQTASGMYIKAIGTVTQNMRDGRHVRVEWTRVDPPREWYFYTYRKTVWEVWPGKGTIPWAADALISFAFENKLQDYSRFVRQWGWLGDEAADTNVLDPPLPSVTYYAATLFHRKHCRRGVLHGARQIGGNSRTLPAQKEPYPAGAARHR